MSVYIDNVQVGYVQDPLASIMPAMLTVMFVMIVVALIKSFVRGG